MEMETATGSTPLPGTADDPLSAPVRAHIEALAHAGELPPAAANCGARGLRRLTGEAGRVEQGTRVRFSLELEAGRIAQVRYRAYGCPYTLATCEWLARRLTGLAVGAAGTAVGGRGTPSTATSVLGAAVGSPAEWAAALGIPPQRLGRLLVVEDALHRALSSSGTDDASQHSVGLRPGSDSAMTHSG